jgi:hypothetical protein
MKIIEQHNFPFFVEKNIKMFEIYIYNFIKIINISLKDAEIK